VEYDPAFDLLYNYKGGPIKDPGIPRLLERIHDIPTDEEYLRERQELERRQELEDQRVAEYIASGARELEEPEEVYTYKIEALTKENASLEDRDRLEEEAKQAKLKAEEREAERQESLRLLEEEMAKCITHYM